MGARKIVVFLLFFIAGCNSPMNERILDGETEGKSSIEKTSFESSLYEAEVKWVDGPFGNIKKLNHLIVFLYKDGKLSSLADHQSLEFYATMPSMGHPMEDAGFFEEIDEGIFVNKTIRYNMPGDWKNELWIMDADFNIADKLEWHDFF